MFLLNLSNYKKFILSAVFLAVLLSMTNPLPVSAKIKDPNFDPNPPAPPHEEECEIELFSKLIILPTPDNPHPTQDSPSPEKLRQLANKLEQKGMTEKASFLRQTAEAMEAIQTFCQGQTDPETPGTGDGDINTSTGIN